VSNAGLSDMTKASEGAKASLLLCNTKSQKDRKAVTRQLSAYFILKYKYIQYKLLSVLLLPHPIYFLCFKL
jgi:hypothetical protein